MKIQSFGSKRIYSGRLPYPDKKKKSPVVITELEVSDRANIRKYISRWSHTTYGDLIIGDFLQLSQPKDSIVGKKVKYFVVECPKVKTKKRIKAFTKVTINDERLNINFLQSERQITKRTLTGAGSCLLYAATQLAKALKKESIHLIGSDASIPFYRKFGFVFPRKFYFEGILSEKKYEDLIKKVEKKFKLKKIK